MNNSINQLDLTETQNTLPPKEKKKFSFSMTETFSRTDYVLGHKTNLNKFKKIELIQNTFSDNH